VEIGFYAIPKAGGPPKVQPKRLRDITVREALNAIALESDARAWIYDEQRCGAEGTFTIAFVHDSQLVR